MAGPYSWRPPGYWFSGRYGATRGSTAEQGDNEHIPPFASLKKFIPPDKLWPINDTWYFPRRLEPEERRAAEHQARGRPALRAVRRRRGVHPQSPTGALRIDAGPVRGLRRERVGEPQDDHLLDAQQPLAVVLRQHLRLLPAARRGLLTARRRASGRCRWCSTRTPRATTRRPT